MLPGLSLEALISTWDPPHLKREVGGEDEKATLSLHLDSNDAVDLLSYLEPGVSKPQPVGQIP